MGILDDTAIFFAVVKQGGFSHAAKYLGLSNGLISRRISALESALGVSLIKRTTRQISLTPEGELFWQHAQRIQQEIDAAQSLIQSSSKKPSGTIRISAPRYFGRHYLTPILMKFLSDFKDIHIELMLNNHKFDPIKEKIDLVLRGTGYLDKAYLKDSNLKINLLIKEKIKLFASPDYVLKYGGPKSIAELTHHSIINFTELRPPSDKEEWEYRYNNKKEGLAIKPTFNCNDIESTLMACIMGHGIARLTELNVQKSLQQQQLISILNQYDWGDYYLYAIYPQQQALPKRTRLLLDFIKAHTQNLLEKVSVVHRHKKK